MGSRLILLSPLQMETVTKIFIKMRPLSFDGIILIKVLFHCVLHLQGDIMATAGGGSSVVFSEVEKLKLGSPGVRLVLF